MSESRGPNDAPPTVPGVNPPSAGGAAPPGGGVPGRPAAAPPGGVPGRPTAAPRPSGQGLTLLALGVAGLALLLAFGSAIFAWRAIDQAEDAKAIALKPAAAGGASTSGPDGGQPATTAPTGADSAAPDDTPRSPGEAPPLGKDTNYEPRYEKETLVLQASCSYSMYADLDEPRAQNDEDGADVRFTRGCGNDPSTLRLEDGVEGTDAATAGMTPQECADKIRTALIGENQAVPVRKGAAICITTDFADAKAHGRAWRMALIEVVGVANDGAATVQVTGWDIPDA